MSWREPIRGSLERKSFELPGPAVTCKLLPCAQPAEFLATSVYLESQSHWRRSYERKINFPICGDCARDFAAKLNIEIPPSEAA